MIEFVSNAGVSLALDRRGSGPQAVLFVHGWISSRRMWDDVIERLDLSRFTTYALDLRGVGLSDRPQAGHDLAGYASDVRAAIAAIDAPLTIVAHSMGGKIAQFIALDRDPRVQRLLLVAPGSARGFALDEKHHALARAAYGSRERIATFQRGAMTKAIAPLAMERIVDDALTAQFEAWFHWYEFGRTADFFDRLAEITLPTMVVAGARDPLAPPSRLRRDVVQPIAGSLFVNLRDVGHNVPVEAPAELALAIARFVDVVG